MITECHKAFLEQLRASSDSVFAVALWLHRQGFDVRVPALNYAPTADQHEAYADEADLFVRHGARRERPVGVKQISVPWDSRETWPFRQNGPNKAGEVYVDRQHNVDKRPDTIAYFTTNPALTAAMMVRPKATRDHWYLKNSFNTAANRWQMVYVCPFAQAEFVDLLELPVLPHERKAAAERLAA